MHEVRLNNQKQKCPKLNSLSVPLEAAMQYNVMSRKARLEGLVRGWGWSFRDALQASFRLRRTCCILVSNKYILNGSCNRIRVKDISTLFVHLCGLWGPKCEKLNSQSVGSSLLLRKT